ncbi:unnamed protein product [Alternaria alternata]
MYIPNTRWTWAFMLTAICQVGIALALESYVFSKFQNEIHFAAEGAGANETRTIPTFLAVFMFGYIYQLFLTWDALRMKNTIQVIGLVLYNIGILVYAAIQFDQIKDAADDLNTRRFIPKDFWEDVKPMLIALPVLMAFAWTIYKRISADTRLKRRYLTYQIYIALLKFDFFFFLAFTVQFLVVVEDTKTVELILTAAALVITFFLLFRAAWWAHPECGLPMQTARRTTKPARKSLTAFAILTILLLIITIVTACLCTHNFNKGLKPHVNDKIVQSDKTYNTEMPSLSGPAPSQRMEID